MRVTKQEITTIEQTETVTQEVLCNKCTLSLRKIDYTDMYNIQHSSFYGIVEYTYKGGYNSHPLQDITSYTFSLCEPCLSEMFESFTIPVGVDEYDIYDGSPQADAERQDKFSQIYESKDVSELTNFLLDQNPTVRAYAQVKIKQLDQK
jgi:hypothetical protein